MAPRGKRADRGEAQSRTRANDWMDGHAVLFEHFDEMARRWLDRRREALDATRQSMEEMRNVGEMGEMFRIQQEWIAGSVRRLTADLGELSHTALTFAQRAASALPKIAEAGIQSAGRSRDEILSAAGSKPSGR